MYSGERVGVLLDNAFGVLNNHPIGTRREMFYLY